MPGAGHAHMGVERPPVVEVNEQVLPARLDGLDGQAGQMGIRDGGEWREDFSNGLSGEHPLERAGGAMDRVSFGHWKLLAFSSQLSARPPGAPFPKPFFRVSS